MIRYALAFGTVLFGALPALSEPCQLVRMASVDASVDGSEHLYIPAELSGRKTKLMVDTGGAWSMIKEELADELKLERHYSQNIYIVDASGTALRQYVSVPKMKLGELTFTGRVDFIVMPGYRGNIDDDGGTIGLNVIARFDVEMDSAAKKVNLFHPKHCPRMGAYWADEYVDLPLINASGLPETKLEIEGEEFRALIDTGATRTFMDLDIARRKFGVTPTSPGVTPRGEMELPSGKKTKTYAYTFKKLILSGFHFNDVEVILNETDGLTLGMRELNELHLYFSFKEERLYATTADARRR